MAQKRSKYISLRLVLIVWSILFSVVPLALVAGYSIVKFEKAIENEQLQRLRSNAREIEVMVGDFYNDLRNNRDSLSTNPHITFNLSVNDDLALRDFLTEWLGSGEVSHVAAYNRDGKRITFAEKEYYTSLKMTVPNANTNLDPAIMAHLANKRDYGYTHGLGSGLELVLVSRIHNSAKKVIGYLEQKYLLKQMFLSRIKNDLKLEMLMVNEKFELINSTFANAEEIPPAGLATLRNSENETLVDLRLNSGNFAFMVYTILWDQSPLRIVIGTSKKESEAVLKNINVAYLGITALGVVLLIIAILITSSVLLKPVNELISSLEQFENSESLVQLKVKNRTEIGLLISTFNQMSLRAFKAKNDLKTKIAELEQANKDLKEAQAQLVHSAKMTSLGQLVAGVAHELNNPIAFIYSNTSYLREYTEKLFKLIDEIEKHPEKAAAAKDEYEFDYIKKDLPMLIKSCQEGAQRTRDIVIGLRNFSRLEESQLKDIDIRDSINMTLELLKGETKNRIQIHKQFGETPLIHCYASQINQVIMNILSNAVHAIHGNGQIWIATSLVKKDSFPDQIQISIKDSGTGMSAEVVEKIFEPFFTTKEVGKGTGLGLSISYGIVQNHGGDIRVKSEPGVGTEFTILIPVEIQKKS